MRLFVAIVAPAQVRAALVALQAEAKDVFAPVSHAAANKVDGKEGVLLTPKSNWKITNPEQLHITLQFLGGEVNVHKAHEAEKALEAVAADGGGASAIHPFAMPCIRVGAFPSERRASVLWAGVGGGEVMALARAVEAALAPAGFAPDKPFVPHVTFARNKFGADAAQFVEGRREKKWSEKEWKVDGFALFESVQELGGGYGHRVVREYKLA